MTINSEALVEDEVFLILVFIYQEAKRQESNVCSYLMSTGRRILILRQNSSVSAGTDGW
jgi:hypothetical protein